VHVTYLPTVMFSVCQNYYLKKLLTYLLKVGIAEAGFLHAGWPSCRLKQ